MFENVSIEDKLNHLREKKRGNEDTLISEAERILKKDLFTEKKILEHLKLYKSSFEKADEEDLESDLIFSLSEIRRVAILYRLKFLHSGFYKPGIPQEAGFKVEYLNGKYAKEIKEFHVLSTHKSFTDKRANDEAVLFVKTNYDNYYLVHRWGKPMKWHRRITCLPLRSFDTLVITVLLVTLVIATSLPTRLITLDHKATYWSGYRAAAFFHLLIFNFGVTVYFTFAFAKNFSSTVWNRYKDFG